MQSDLIREIYANATGPGKLVEIMARVGRQFGADSSFMFTSHSESAPEAILLGHNMGADVIRSFADYWCREDVWAHEASRRSMMTRNVVVAGDQLVEKDQLHRTRYYNEFAKSADMDSMLGSVLFDGTEQRNGIPFTNLCWYRRPGRERFQVEDVRTLRALLPHLQQALLLQRQMQDLSLEHLLAGASAVRPGAASFLLESDGRIVARNGIAETLLAGRPSLARYVGERLVGLGGRSAPTITEALAQCATSQSQVRMLIQEHGSGRLLPATLNAIPVETYTYVGAFARPSYLLIIEMPYRATREIVKSASEWFGFTDSETAVAMALLNGMTVEQIAQERKSSVATVRTQVRSILNKSGNERQVDLIRTLCSLMR